jgi:hypothetical protein
MNSNPQTVFTFSTEEECKSFLFEKFHLEHIEAQSLETHSLITEFISFLQKQDEQQISKEEYNYTLFKEDISNYISTKHPLAMSHSQENEITPSQYRIQYLSHISKYSKIGHYFVVMKYIQKKVKQAKKNRSSTITFQIFDFEEIEENIVSFDDFLQNIERNVMSNFSKEEQSNYFNLSFQDRCNLQTNPPRQNMMTHQERRLPLFWNESHSHLHSIEQLNGFELHNPSPEGIMIDNFFKPIFSDIQNIHYEHREIIPTSYQEILNQLENTNIPIPNRTQSNIDEFDNFYRLHDVSETNIENRPQNIDELIHERENLNHLIVNNNTPIEIEMEFDSIPPLESNTE